MELRITATQLDELHDWLVQDDEIERFAFLHCSERNGTLLVESVDPVADEECTVQRRTGVALDLESEIDRLNESLERKQVPILTHSHPFSELPGFSGQDHEMFRVYRDWLGPLYPERSLGFAVLGRSGMDTTVFEALGTEERETLPVEVIGDWKSEVDLNVPTDENAQPEVDVDRYDRSIRAFGETGQAELADAHVCIVGAGGLGSMAAEQLARLGIGQLTLVDPDVVEESNLPRIYGAADHHVGRPKVEVVAQHLWEVNPDIEVRTHQARAQDVATETLADCDVLIGAVDRVTARSYLNELAVKHLVPYLDAGVVIKTDATEGPTIDVESTIAEELGVAQLVVPGVNGCLSCLGRHDPERARLERLDEEQLKEEIDRGYIEGDVLTPQPAVTPLNGVMATQIARIVGKLVTGYETPPDMVQYRGLEDDLSSIATHRDIDCQTCGEAGVLGRGERTPDVELVGGKSFESAEESADGESVQPATPEPGSVARASDDAESEPSIADESGHRAREASAKIDEQPESAASGELTSDQAPLADEETRESGPSTSAELGSPAADKGCEDEPAENGEPAASTDSQESVPREYEGHRSDEWSHTPTEHPGDQPVDDERADRQRDSTTRVTWFGCPIRSLWWWRR
ncbi:ThiF family adenylyltransferase [Haloarcula sp. AONF1]